MSFLTEEKEIIIKNFAKFVKEQLNLNEVPEIIIQNGKNGLKTTANYDYNGDNKIIRVNGKNRALVDILRSLAHEMVHHKQYEEGRLKIKPKDIGGDIEDEANAKAGQYIKIYAKENPSIYEE
jgi:hypothetical protein